MQTIHAYTNQDGRFRVRKARRETARSDSPQYPQPGNNRENGYCGHQATIHQRYALGLHTGLRDTGPCASENRNRWTFRHFGDCLNTFGIWKTTQEGGSGFLRDGFVWAPLLRVHCLLGVLL